VTAGTYGKAHLFDTPERRTRLTDVLLAQAQHFGWRLQAWAVMTNHYHFVAYAPEDATKLRRMLQATHSLTARAVNQEDGKPGRKVWFQYWDTRLTHQSSYLARLRYVHTNPVKHGVARDAENYPWCSMAWFTREAPPAFVRTVLGIDSEGITIEDDF